MDYSTNCQSFVSADDLFVDDLLDLSNAFFPELNEADDSKGHKPACCSLSPPKKTENNNDDKQIVVTNKSPAKQDFASLTLLGSELSLPPAGGDLDNLEWLSHFVEDSFSEYSLTYSPANLPEKPRISPVQEKSCFTGPVQTKAAAPIWPLGPPSSSTTENKPAAGRKPKKKMEKRATTGGKQCCHCGVQKTPLWRTGPLGEKTLCNACGVRFKSGRLLPEYRPASSPTFSTGLHSNSHRKVLEMRQKKGTEPGQPVQTF